MKASTLKLMMNLWPPFLAAGIRVLHIAEDYSEVRVRMKLHWFNRNYVRTHFGGSLFAMTDPFYMLMYLNRIGKEYVVWDKAASIEFVRPGRGTVTASFFLDQAMIERARADAASGKPALIDHEIEVVDDEGRTVARSTRTIYVRLKRGRVAEPDEDRAGAR
ncbi:tetrameric acyl-CoA thioesterase [Leptolyngbya valderiana BDU 20041]|nr:tetrameric acyl-CoA thioesterase [Leptolyngbya valderiana BDU 20041]